MEFEGSVVQLLQQARGTSARGEWVKQEVIFEQQGEFGRKICVSFWGDKAMDAASLKPGQKVKVAANIESREYNGRWYTEARAWRIEPLTAAPAPAPGGMPADAFPPVDESGGTSEGTSEGTGADEFDDLPF